MPMPIRFRTDLPGMPMAMLNTNAKLMPTAKNQKPQRHHFRSATGATMSTAYATVMTTRITALQLSKTAAPMTIMNHR
jgi:hypothetical protein